MLIALAYFIPAVVTWWWAARYFADDFGTDAEDLVLASVLAFCVAWMWPVAWIVAAGAWVLRTSVRDAQEDQDE